LGVGIPPQGLFRLLPGLLPLPHAEGEDPLEGALSRALGHLLQQGEGLGVPPQALQDPGPEEEDLGVGGQFQEELQGLLGILLHLLPGQVQKGPFPPGRVLLLPEGKAQAVVGGGLGQGEPPGQLQGHPAGLEGKGRPEGGLTRGGEKAPLPEKLQGLRAHLQDLTRLNRPQEGHPVKSPARLRGKELPARRLLRHLGHPGQGQRRPPKGFALLL